MILGIGAEGEIFLYAGLAGMSVLFTYDILICFRKLIRHGNLASGIEDMIFWIAASIYIFRKMYETTYGSIRWFFVIGVLCGAGVGHLFIRLLLKLKKSLEKYRKTG